MKKFDSECRRMHHFASRFSKISGGATPWPPPLWHARSARGREPLALKFDNQTWAPSYDTWSIRPCSIFHMTACKKSVFYWCLYNDFNTMIELIRNGNISGIYGNMLEIMGTCLKIMGWKIEKGHGMKFWSWKFRINFPKSALLTKLNMDSVTPRIPTIMNYKLILWVNCY